MSEKKVLFVLTSHNQLKNGHPTGWYLPEAAHPYYVLSKHFIVDWASPQGGKAPLDPSSIEAFSKDDQCQQFLSDEKAKKGFENTKKLSEIDVDLYQAIIYVGGHGPCFDLAQDQINIQLAQQFWNKGKIVAAVCHGPAAIVNVKDQHGKSIVQGRRVTSFSNDEEEQIKLTDQIPFLVETRLKQLGGLYEKNPQLWGSHVTVDGQLILGANPASAHQFGQAILDAIEKK